MELNRAQAALDLVAGDTAPPVTQIEPLSGGVSNLSFRLVTEGDSFVLRMPPPGVRTGNAHDMVREAKVIETAGLITDKVPRLIGYSDDPSVLGDCFLVMEYLKGQFIGPNSAVSMPKEQARRLCENFVDLLADLHEGAVPQKAASIFGDPDSFVDRQVKGWSRRFEALNCDVSYQSLLEWIRTNQPHRSERVSLLHNDFKFDNLALNIADPSQIIGVLNWELAGLGDPFMDLGNALAYWVEATDSPHTRKMKRGPTDLPGMMTRAEIVGTYCARRNIAPPDNFRFYEVMGLFRLAVIALQVHVRMTGSSSASGVFRIGALDLLNRALTLTEE